MKQHQLLKYCLHHLFWLLSLSGLASHALAEVITDGSLGQAIQIEGPNYTISQDLGKTVGKNAFHSFDRFNIFQGETATFETAPTTMNLITRIGHHTSIDGIVNAEANLYLLSPQGLFIGPHAKFNTSSLHLSTAVGIKFEEGGTFWADTTKDSHFSSASPQQFGFLDSPPANITLKDNTLHLENPVTTAHPITLYAPNGEIQLDLTKPAVLENTIFYAPNGKIHITSSDHLEISQDTSLIDYQPRQAQEIANLDVAGYHNGGYIEIAVNELIINGATIFADLYDSASNAQIKIIVPKRLILRAGARITSDNYSNAEQSGEIFIETDSIELTGFNNDFDDFLTKIGIEKEFRDKSTASTIATNALSIPQAEWSGRGYSGEIKIIANELRLEGGILQTNTDTLGDAGSITLHIDKIFMLDNSMISATTGSEEVWDTGQGGNIKIVANQLRMDKSINQLRMDKSIILVSSAGQGNAGTINIQTGNLNLLNKSGISSEAEQASGGNISLKVNNLTLQNQSRITAEILGLAPNESSGDLDINANNMILLNHSDILANANAGYGGNIHIASEQLIRSSDSRIDASSERGIDGEVLINAPNPNMEALLINLPIKLQVLRLQLCTPRNSGISHFNYQQLNFQSPRDTPLLPRTF